MGKDRNCKVCAVYVTSVDKYVKYEGMCGKCWNLSRIPKFVSYECYVCKNKKTGIKLGLYNTMVCDECYDNHSYFCGKHGNGNDTHHDKCLLTGKCCLCRDKRKIKKEGTYDGYIDGVGHVTMKNRWDFYCDSCCRSGYSTFSNLS
jgi:hypothetical protein